MQRAVSYFHIQDNKVLLVLKGDIWIMAGGKPKFGETNLACLYRESSEELPQVKVQVGKKYGIFRGTTPHSKKLRVVSAYEATCVGMLTPGAEIKGAGYFSLEEIDDMAISDITLQIIEALAKDKRLT